MVSRWMKVNKTHINTHNHIHIKESILQCLKDVQKILMLDFPDHSRMTDHSILKGNSFQRSTFWQVMISSG